MDIIDKITNLATKLLGSTYQNAPVSPIEIKKTAVIEDNNKLF